MGDSNAVAYQHLDVDYNFAGYPSVFVDGGVEVRVGGTYDTTYFTGAMDAVYHNAVDDLDLAVTLNWIGGSELAIDLQLSSNDLTNEPPETPSTPQGSTSPKVGEPETYVTSTTDLDGDEIWYQWCVGAICLDWYGPYSPGDTCQLTRTFGAPGDVDIMVKAKDNWEETAESTPLTVTVSDLLCGDANGDELVNITDAVYLIDFIFNGGPAPDPLEVGDSSCDSLTNITDAVFLINFIFNGGPAPCETCP